ncbi:hypothetical protein HY224_01380 [Candidatus Uhrbacteria bacterium]|nr:hypothetical protein [Candidatus Uhrbacteria bacterium]
MATGPITPPSFWSLIQKSNQILILFPKGKNGDSAAAALALSQFLRKNKIRAEVACEDFVKPSKLSFLPEIDKIQPNIKILKKFVVSIDISRSQIEEFSYNIADTKLNIFITPKTGTFYDRDISTSNSEYRYDLIITLDTPDLEHLGKIYNENAEFFYNTPIINIDNAIENEQYGQVNIVDLTAPSCGEMVFSIIQSGQPDAFSQPDALDPDLATTLLTGIILKTRGFRSNHITPKTLEIVSQLIAAGAKREKIIHHIYQTKSIETLKIWGKALANLKHDPEIGLVWTALTHEDIGEPHADTHENLREVSEELINTSPEAKIVCLLYETPEKGIRCLANSAHGISAFDASRSPVRSWRPGNHPEQTAWRLKRSSWQPVERPWISGSLPVPWYQLSPSSNQQWSFAHHLWLTCC